MDRREARNGGAQVNVGGSQKKRKGVVRTQSADTQEYKSCQRNDRDVDVDEYREELVSQCGEQLCWLV